ncbi:MAG: restriction endonuclease [Trebonia sp.]
MHALAGVMDDMNAAKGVLVTTSWVGKASRDFAASNGNRIQIIEGRELKHLLREHLSIDALISLPKLPPGWHVRGVGRVAGGQAGGLPLGLGEVQPPEAMSRSIQQAGSVQAVPRVGLARHLIRIKRPPQKLAGAP